MGSVVLAFGSFLHIHSAMHSRSYRSRRPPRRPVPKAPPAPVWGDYALVQLDAVPLRQAAVLACKRARTTFEKAEAELLYYEKKDVPAFEAWHRVNFGPQLKEIETLERDVEKVRERVERMILLRMHAGYSGKQAKQLVEAEEREEMEEDHSSASDEEAQQDFQERFKRQEEMWKDLVISFEELLNLHSAFIERSLKQKRSARDIRKALEVLFVQEMELPENVGIAFFRREDVETLWGKYKLGLDAAPEEVKNPASPEARIKRLMRELAFALHPDQCGVADERRLALWHQVQEAVKSKDLDRLEVLHAHMQLLQGDLGPGLSVGRILDLTQNYRKSREALRRKIRELRKNKAWGFSLVPATDKEALRKKMEAGYKATLRNLREDIANAEAFYKELCRR